MSNEGKTLWPVVAVEDLLNCITSGHLVLGVRNVSAVVMDKSGIQGQY